MSDTATVTLTDVQKRAKQALRKYPTFQRAQFTELGSFFRKLKEFYALNPERDMSPEAEHALQTWLMGSFLSAKTPPLESFLHPDIAITDKQSGVVTMEKRRSPSGINLRIFLEEAGVDPEVVPTGVTTGGEDLQVMLSGKLERSDDVYRDWVPPDERETDQGV